MEEIKTSHWMGSMGQDPQYKSYYRNKSGSHAKEGVRIDVESSELFTQLYASSDAAENKRASLKLELRKFALLIATTVLQ